MIVTDFKRQTVAVPRTMSPKGQCCRQETREGIALQALDSSESLEVPRRFNPAVADGSLSSRPAWSTQESQCYTKKLSGKKS